MAVDGEVCACGGRWPFRGTSVLFLAFVSFAAASLVLTSELWRDGELTFSPFFGLPASDFLAAVALNLPGSLNKKLINGLRIRVDLLPPPPMTFGRRLRTRKSRMKEGGLCRVQVAKRR